jgi:hypothetical protein
MPRKLPPLLCELHAHTTWSDGILTVRELADLYGRRGFDVVCVTDHVLHTRNPWAGRRFPLGSSVDASRFDAYLEEIAGEAERALAAYGLLLIPGLELTADDPDPMRGAHAVAVGVRSFVGVDEGLEFALTCFRARRPSARSSSTCGRGGRRTSSTCRTARSPTSRPSRRAVSARVSRTEAGGAR